MGVLSQKTAYSAYYGDFRGVDFSSDHTQVLNQRLAYAVNMYKDYQSGEGKAVETIPGFRRLFQHPFGDPVYGIHQIKLLSGETRVLVHAGSDLFYWKEYPASVNVRKETVHVLGEPETVPGTSMYRFVVSLDVERPYTVTDVLKADKSVLDRALWGYSNTSDDPYTLTINSSELKLGDPITVIYYEYTLDQNDAIWGAMAYAESRSFVFQNKLYIIDGQNYLVYDGDTIRRVDEDAYVPTTYINIVPGNGAAASAGTEHEQRNSLTPLFKNTFIADGVAKEYLLNENSIDGVESVVVYGETLSLGSDYTVDLERGCVVLNTAPFAPEEAGYPENHAGVVITARKALSAAAANRWRLCAVFDERPFFSGDPENPCYIYYCGRNEQTGLIDPSYLPILHRVPAGTTNVPVTALVPVAGTLMALKGDTQQDGSVYYFSPVETGDNVVPIIYHSTRGLAGIGCLGAAVNFLDDPVFVSRLGLEGVGQLSTRLERAIEHRSSLVDAKLCNLDLTKATLAEWNGYLWLLCDGKIFLADSRQRFTHDSGVMQYEWYYLEDIGVFDGQYDEYRYAERVYDEIREAYVEFVTDDGDVVDLPLEAHPDSGEVANPADEAGKAGTVVYHDQLDSGYVVDYVVKPDEDVFTGAITYHAYLVESRGGKTGGVFKPATMLFPMPETILFGTANGVICAFNFDKRGENGEIHPSFYDFDGRAILCGCATKMDNCGIPGLTKTTVKKSTVIKTKSMQTTSARIKVRTNKKPYEQISRIASSRFAFDNVDFADFSFLDESDSLYAVKEKEKKWVEKQYYLYSNEYRRPFALYYITYRYTVAGRYKQ